MYRRKDSYYHHAKAAGYRSRAAYKLLELARQQQLIRHGDHVVDLGAWPGGWLQIAAELVGRTGIVVGVDLVAIEPLANPVVSCIRGDVADPAVQAEIRSRCGGRVDVVLSDLAPKLTGIRATDAARAAALAETAVGVACDVLRPGGRLLLKIFSGPDSELVVADLRRRFQTVKRTRPRATRARSSELYVIAVDLRPAVAAS